MENQTDILPSVGGTVPLKDLEVGDKTENVVVDGTATEGFVVDNGKANLLEVTAEDDISHYPSEIFSQIQQSLETRTEDPASFVVTTQPSVFEANFGLDSKRVFCSFCQNYCATAVRESYQTPAFIWAFILFCFSGACCAIIPFLRKDLKQVDHYCPHCKQMIGTYQPKMKKETVIILLSVLLIGLCVVGVSLYFLLSAVF